MESLLHELLDARDYLLADGATGTNYFELGLGAGDSPELWNADHADRVKALHRAFIEAGSDIVLTNTFGGNRYRLKLHDAENRVFELNELAAKNARAEADRHRRGEHFELQRHTPALRRTALRVIRPVEHSRNQ